MAAPMKRVVAWAGRAEWIHVYEELYSGDVQKQKHALDKIAVWKCRANKLSTAIECTWELLSAELQYQNVMEDTGLREQDRMLRILFAMALIRFINLITEKGQTSRYAQPVHHLADDLGLPQWMVSLRHDAVHSNIPSLAVLRSGVQISLAWLKEVYWEAQLEEEEDPDLLYTFHPLEEIPASETVEHVTQILEAYTNQYFTMFSDKGSSPSKGEMRQLQPILDSLEEVINSNREVALPVLIEDGLMLLTQEQLEAFNIKKKDLVAERDLRLPAQLLMMWSPVLRVIHRLRSTHQLLSLLLTQKPECSFFRLRQAMGWTMEVIIAREENRSGGSKEDPLTMVYRNAESDVLKYHRLLRACLENPNCHTVIILPCLMRQVRPRLTQQQEERLMTLVNTYTQKLNAESGHEDGKDDGQTESEQIFSVKDLSIVAKPMEWCECPLGYFPEQTLSYTSLELPEHVNNLGGQCKASITPEPSHTPTRQKGSRKRTNKNGLKKPVDSHLEDTVPPSKLNRTAEWTAKEVEAIQRHITLF